MTYQTAYMKANYPVEFLAASMTLDMGNTDKLAEFRAEAERLGIKVEPPSINRSGVEFDVAGNAIHYALAALRGVGRQAVESVVAARGERPFADLADFARRINPRALNKRVLESLAAAGAFDAVEPNRARVFAAVDALLATAQRTHDDAARGQSELFGGPASPEPLALPAIEPWLPAERLQREYEAVGFFLSGHPLDDYAAALKRLRVQSWAEFSRAVKAGAGAGRVAGTVVSRTERRTQNGTKMGIIGLSDPSGHYEAVLFAEGLAQYRDLLEPGTAVLLVPHRRGAGRGSARPHPVGRAARCGGGADAEGVARLPAQRGADPGVARRLEPTRTGPRAMARIRPTARSAWCCCWKTAARSRSSCPAASRFRRKSPAPSRRWPAW